MSRTSKKHLGQFGFFSIKVALSCVLFVCQIGCHAVSGRSGEVKESQADKNTITKEEEVDFFNEIERWLNSSAKSNGIDFAKKRKLFFTRLAEKGFVPAKAALLMFNFDNKPVPNLYKYKYAKALDILLSAANDGDVSSACAVTALMNKVMSTEELILYKKYVQLGADENHFACLAQQARMLRLGDKKPYITENNVADELELRAAKFNYYDAIMARWLVSDNRSFSVGKVNKVLCWLSIKGSITGSINDFLIWKSGFRMEIGIDSNGKIPSGLEILSNDFRSSFDLMDCLNYEAEN